MALTSTRIPMIPNNTMSVYRFNALPPSVAVAIDLGVLLVPNPSCPIHDVENAINYTHTAIVPAITDIRDNKVMAFTPNYTECDVVYIPDSTGTPYKVIHVEVVGAGQPTQYKKIYLDRGTPPWPTNHI